MLQLHSLIYIFTTSHKQIQFYLKNEYSVVIHDITWQFDIYKLQMLKAHGL